MLYIKNIRAGYKNKIIVDNIEFSIKPKEFTALLGLNGAGKTTLLKTICGLLKPISGQVVIGEEDLLMLNEKERARHISFMPQRHSIIYDTKVIDVVLMGITAYLSIFETPNNRHREIAYRMLELIGMDTHAEDNFLNLSGGQKQLIIIARALMQNAEIMLFDEPNSALDFNNEHMVLENIRNIIKSQNKIGIITLHDPNLALQYCDKIIILKNGAIFSEFNTKDVNSEFLFDVFSKIYGKISIIEHMSKYVIVR
ncbi:MAG: ABC transporter ATP-binding protein [Tissierellaceae bacterium]|nr:ABC transporter ATP-binding protein [Tissierellaceae bacterium]